MRRVGVLMVERQEPSTAVNLLSFRDELRSLGWIAGSNIEIDTRWADGDEQRIRSYATELLDKNPDVLLASGGRAAASLKKLTQVVPIVFVGPSDPVTSGFVESLARPGRNLTGFSRAEPAIVGKMLEILAEIAPGAECAGLILHPDNPGAAGYTRALQFAAASLKLKTAVTPVRDQHEIERGISNLAQQSRSILIVAPDLLMLAYRELIIRLANEKRIPAIYSDRTWTATGGLVSYGDEHFSDTYRRAASYVDRILRGEKPRDLPVQAATNTISPSE